MSVRRASTCRASGPIIVLASVALAACGGETAGDSAGGGGTSLDAGTPSQDAADSTSADASVPEGSPDSAADAPSDSPPADAAADSGPGWKRVPGEVSTALVFVPSSAAGTTGLATHVAWPKTAQGARYAQGAPVVVLASGGLGTGDLPPAGAPMHAAYGFVSISFAFPGGGKAPGASGGTFDYRGEACLRALADVVRFAAGKSAARVGQGTEHKTLEQLTGIPVLESNIGILGSSHGGNVSAVALGSHGAEMDVAWYVGWENPSGDQFVTVELGGKGNVNPYYAVNSCKGESCTVDYAKLAVDTSEPAVVTDSVKTPPVETVQLAGTVYFDTNGNGKHDPGEIKMSPAPGRPAPGGPLLGYFSVELTEALAARSLLAAPLATVAQAKDFWSKREASAGGQHWSNAAKNRPGLMVLLLATEQDHVQGTPDHPHIKVQYDGWRAAGAKLVRLNPDAAYLAQLGAVTAIDNPANRDFDWAELVAALEPEGTESKDVLTAAGVEEMADRVQAGVLDADLSTPLWY
jgi:hypothetical protein